MDKKKIEKKSNNSSYIFLIVSIISGALFTWYAVLFSDSLLFCLYKVDFFDNHDKQILVVSLMILYYLLVFVQNIDEVFKYKISHFLIPLSIACSLLCVWPSGNNYYLKQLQGSGVLHLSFYSFLLLLTVFLFFINSVLWQTHIYPQPCIFKVLLHKKKPKAILKKLGFTVNNAKINCANENAESLKLGYKNYFSVLLDYLEDNNLEHNIIGLYGEWGTGKTKLMNCLRCKIDEYNGSQSDLKKDQFDYIWYQPWKFHNEMDLLSPLLYLLYEKIENKYQEKGVEITHKLGNIIQEILKYGLKKATGFESGSKLTFLESKKDSLAGINKIQENVKEAIEFLLYGTIGQKKDKRLIIFIDDLERCDAEKVMKFIESLHILFDLNDVCKVIVAVDREKLLEAIRTRYKDGDSKCRESAELYLEKVIKIPFELRPVDSSQFKDLVELWYDNNNLLEKWKKIFDEVKDPDGAVYKDRIVELFSHIGNPRQLERVLVEFHHRLKLYEKMLPDGTLSERNVIDYCLIAKISTIYICYPKIHNALEKNVDLYYLAGTLFSLELLAKYEELSEFIVSNKREDIYKLLSDDLKKIADLDCFNDRIIKTIQEIEFDDRLRNILLVKPQFVDSDYKGEIKDVKN